LVYLLSCSIIISEDEKSIQRVECEDKHSAKKCKKLKKKGKCENKKIWKKCMETCQKCTPGTIAIDNVQLFDRNSNSKKTISLVEKFLKI
jgi:hypothetical protein